jgi:hypothetical protein
VCIHSLGFRLLTVGFQLLTGRVLGFDDRAIWAPWGDFFVVAAGVRQHSLQGVLGTTDELAALKLEVLLLGSSCW